MATRGRPPEDSLPAFLVKTGIWEVEKIQVFAKRMRLTKQEAVGVMILLWDWVSKNRGLTGDITDADFDIIADHCGFAPKNRRRNEFLPALIASGLVDQEPMNHDSNTIQSRFEGSVQQPFKIKIHDWPENQPLVRKRISERKSGGLSERKIAEKPPESLPKELDGMEGKKECIPSKASDARAREAVVDKLTTKTSEPPNPPRPSSAKARFPSNPNGAKMPPEIVMLANDLLNTAHIADRQDRRDIAWDVYHSIKANREQDVHQLISEIRQGEHREARNIVAIIRSKLRPEPG